MNNTILEYLEGYFGGELNESISDDNIMGAFAELLETANAVEEYMNEAFPRKATESVNEARRSFKARVDKLAPKMNIQRGGVNYAAAEPADMHYLDRNIAGHEVSMSAQHMPNRNRSRIDFTVDAEAAADPNTGRTNKIGVRNARRILTNIAAFAQRHNDNMPSGHETEFKVHKASAYYKNPEARTKVYRKMVNRLGGKGAHPYEVDPKSNPMSPTVRRPSTKTKGPITTFRVKK